MFRICIDTCRTTAPIDEALKPEHQQQHNMSEHTPTPNTHHLTSSKSGTFYFAFGSNLSAVQMSIRLSNSPASSVPVAVARLDNYKWIICERGYANVVLLPPSSTGGAVNGYTDTLDEDQNVVWGLIYNMSAGDEAVLDRYEGHDDWRNPEPEINPDAHQRAWKPMLQGGWDYNKHHLPLTVTKWLRDPAEYGVEVDTQSSSEETETVIRALVYVDEQRTSPGEINAEYIGRMNRGIQEAVALGLPETWVDRVMRRWIPEGIEVDDIGYVGTDQGYIEAEATETLDDVKERVVRGWKVKEVAEREEG